MSYSEAVFDVSQEHVRLCFDWTLCAGDPFKTSSYSFVVQWGMKHAILNPSVIVCTENWLNCSPQHRSLWILVYWVRKYEKIYVVIQTFPDQVSTVPFPSVCPITRSQTQLQRISEERKARPHTLKKSCRVVTCIPAAWCHHWWWSQRGSGWKSPWSSRSEWASCVTSRCCSRSLELKFGTLSKKVPKQILAELMASIHRQDLSRSE